MTTENNQPNQTQNEIPLQYYLQQHEITKTTDKFFSNTKYRRVTVNDYESKP